MFNLRQQQKILYLLAAVVLLLQSFAVWHDVDHPFHTSSTQCERLHAINHLPVADITPELAVSLHTESISSEKPHYVLVLPNQPRYQHSIRAPPQFS